MQQNSSPSTRMATIIDFDEKRGRFLIVCPVFDNARIRSLPNRRWDGKGKRWTAPAIRANIDTLASPAFSTAVMSPAAKAKIESYHAERSKGVRPVAFPAYYGFKRDPRAKQLEALHKVYGLNAIALFMDVRTGKTKVVIDLACAARIEDKIHRVILISPLTLRKNWTREFAKDATIPIDYHLLDTKGKGPKDFERWMNKPHDFKWLLVGVESLAAGSAYEYVKRFAMANTKVLCAIDESSKIKTHNANRSEKACEIGRLCEYRLIASGTPMTKSPLDLYMQYEFLDPDIIGLGDYYSFRARYAVMGGYENKMVIGYENLDELTELVMPYTYQVRQSEVFDSTKEYVVREVELSPEQRAIYSDLRKFSRIGDIDRGLVVQNVLEKMLRQQEVVGGFVSYEHTEEQLAKMRETWGQAKKLPRTYRVPIPGANPKVSELLACTEDYEGSTIVWCAFKDEIYAVRDALRAKYGDDQVVEIHGDIDEHTRDQNVNVLFQGRKARFIVGNAATGGMGLTMDTAENIFYYSGTFNYVDRVQSEDRGTCPGKTTLIVDIVARGTVDDTILAANDAKQDVSEYVRGKIDDARRAADMQAALDALMGG